MSQLIAKPELGGELQDYLDQQMAAGHHWVVYDADNPITSVWDLHCFKEAAEAFDFEREYQQTFNWHVAVPIGDLSLALEKIKYSLKNNDMNRNSLEDFREQVKTLKIPAEMAKKAEEAMEKNIQYIQVTTPLESRKGFMEATLHLKRSEQSDYYFLNKYELAYSKARPLENGLQYVVKGDDVKIGDQVGPGIRKFDSPIQAIEHFNKQKTDAELSYGKSEGQKVIPGQTLATMKAGKVDYVAKEFQLTYRSEALKNTVYINEGKGFNMKQSSNMLLGGAAFRDDLVSRQGKQYEAWNTYQFDQSRDRYGNLTIRQYGEGYPFNLNTELNSYKIKELDDTKKLEHVVSQLKDGERPLVTVIGQQGEELKMTVRAMPRYGNLNFYNLDGKVEKREQFLKEPKQDLAKENVLGKNLGQKKGKGQEMAM